MDRTSTQGNRIEFYLHHLAYCMLYFPAWIRYVVADGFYSKYLMALNLAKAALQETQSETRFSIASLKQRDGCSMSIL